MVARGGTTWPAVAHGTLGRTSTAPRRRARDPGAWHNSRANRPSRLKSLPSASPLTSQCARMSCPDCRHLPLSPCTSCPQSYSGYILQDLFFRPFRHHCRQVPRVRSPDLREHASRTRRATPSPARPFPVFDYCWPSIHNSFAPLSRTPTRLVSILYICSRAPSGEWRSPRYRGARSPRSRKPTPTRRHLPRS